MKTKYKLLIFRVNRLTNYSVIETEESYMEDTLIRLIWAILKHRCYHFLQGEGWID
mgnify:CR=1 FL=1